MNRVETEFLWACNYADVLFKRGDALEKRVVTGNDYYRVSVLDRFGQEVKLFSFGAGDV